MQTVELWNFGPEGWCGLILPCTSGTMWTNQAGGLACAQPECEGIYLPMAHQLNHPEPLEDIGAYGPDEYDRAQVATFLAENGLWFLEPLNRGDEPAMIEAWLWVAVKDFGERDKYKSTCPVHLHPFQGREVILTWQNSD